MDVHVPWKRHDAAGVELPGGSDWNRVLVYGLGVSGRAAASWLRCHGVEVLAVDGRSAEKVELGELASDAGVTVSLGAEPESLPDETVDAVVVSPGVPKDRPLLVDARRRGLPVIGEVELAFPWLGGPVLGITGSNGKSTTTAMAGAMLKAAGLPARVCGNIGEPLTSQIESHGAGSQPTYVVELSSFQLESVEFFRPRAAALLNLAPDHLDRHADFAEYRDAKLAIFRRQTADDVALLNAGDAEVVASTAGLVARRRFFSSSAPVEDGCFLRQAGGEPEVVEIEADGTERVLFRASDVPLPGPHNLENAMAAALLVRCVGVEPRHIVTGLRTFEGLPHRLQLVRELDGVRWYDDSKGTNLAATVKSLEGFEDGRVLLVLGGIYKGGELPELVSMVRRKARVVFLIGQAAEVFAAALAGAEGISVEVRPVGVLDRAVSEARREARPGEVVLLSPACSSFDQFPNFAERGRIFKRLVHALDGAGADATEAEVSRGA